MFLHVSVILVTGGGLPIACWDTHPPGPDAGTPWDQRQAPILPREQTPPAQCMLGDMGNKRAVRILLECDLVSPKWATKDFPERLPFALATKMLQRQLSSEQDKQHFMYIYTVNHEENK